MIGGGRRRLCDSSGGEARRRCCDALSIPSGGLDARMLGSRAGYNTARLMSLRKCYFR